MSDYEELVGDLREEAEAVKAVEWDIPICTSNHIADAADAIEELVTKCHQLEKERDAAVKEIARYACCGSCRYNDGDKEKELCLDCNWDWKHSNWEWRGVQDE